jgi:crotonobetainyl-CoA:carnitine CoA-transferase CaiB-like acyl-CoA transferase
MSAQSLPLAGVRVLSVEQYAAGPYGTLFLAQLGADVIKIEPPSAPGKRGGDTARGVGPHFLRDGESLFFQAFNLNKRSLTLDLKSEAGQAVLHRLVPTVDAVANNLRGDLPATLGVTHAALKPYNPAIVCAHISAYGRDNGRARWPGYDYLMQAECGFMSVTGEPGTPPARLGLSMVDFMTGTMMAVGLLAALLAARQTGVGRDVDVDLMSAAIHQTTYPALWYLNEGDVTTRMPRSGHPSVVPSQMFRSADGWVFVMAQLPKFWDVLTKKLNRPDLADDPRFRSSADRWQNREVLTALLDEIFSSQTTAHWLQLLQGAMPVAPVHDLDQALDNPFLRESAMIDRVRHPDADIRVLSSPIRLDEQRLANRPAPLLGADSDAVLREAGFAPAEIAELRRQGVV